MSNQEYNSQYVKKRYIWLKLRAIEYKGGKCKNCGYDRYYGALEFHHRNKVEKELVWSGLRNKPWHVITKELDKCDLLCAVCHREEHQHPNLSSIVAEWRIQIDKRKAIPKKVSLCEYCGAKFLGRSGCSKFCSRKCTVAAREVVKWPMNLPDLVRKSSKCAVATQLGVSDRAVSKRLKNHHGV